jgi:hypothetical protein
MVGAGWVTQNGPAPSTRQAKAPSCYSDSPCRNVALIPPTARLPKMREFSMSMLCFRIRVTPNKVIFLPSSATVDRKHRRTFAG